MQPTNPALSVTLPGGLDDLARAWTAAQQNESNQVAPYLVQGVLNLPSSNFTVFIVDAGTFAALRTMGGSTVTPTGMFTCLAQLTEVQAVYRQSMDPQNGAAYISTNPTANMQAPDGTEQLVQFGPQAGS
jgi:hypothetical protein